MLFLALQGFVLRHSRHGFNSTADDLEPRYQFRHRFRSQSVSGEDANNSFYLAEAVNLMSELVKNLERICTELPEMTGRMFRLMLAVTEQTQLQAKS